MSHLVRHDEMMLGFYRHLDVVADDTSAFAAGGHGAGVRISQRDLLVGRGLHLLLHLLQRLHRPTQARDLLLEAGCPGLGLRATLPVGAIQRGEITGDAGLHLLDALGHLGDGEVLVTVVDGLELGAVEGHHRPSE